MDIYIYAHINRIDPPSGVCSRENRDTHLVGKFRFKVPVYTLIFNLNDCLIP